MFWGDSTIFLLIPVLILAFWAQARVRGNYSKYSKIQSAVGLTGAEVARVILDRNGLTQVTVEGIAGELTDHYDPRTQVVRLSEGVYNGQSVAALAIASHECGHALQHARGYKPILLRASILPAANLGSTLAFPLFLAGLFFSIGPLMDFGIILFTGVLLFHLVTLPVEYNASSRALAQLDDQIIIYPEEMKGAKSVLNAAALTYVAATLMALVNLLRLVLLRNSRD